MAPWRGSRRTILLVTAAVAVVGGAFLLPARTVSPRPVAEPVARAAARLTSPDLDERIAGIHELEGLMWRYNSPHQPAVMRVLSGFVRKRAPATGCAAEPAKPADPAAPAEPGKPDKPDKPAEPAEDVEVAMSVLGHRATARDEDTVMDLHGVCLAGIVMTYINLEHANLSGADLTGATFAGMRLTDVDLTGARLVSANLGQAVLVDADLTDADLTGADLTKARWSDGTTWPERYEQAVVGASAPDGPDYVIGKLRL
jgi:hypothetical protein